MKKETTTLPSYMRTLLAEAICDRINIIDYCKQILCIYMEKEKRDAYAGNCIYCFKQNTFIMNKTTGFWFCTACGKEGDFLTLVSDRKEEDLNGTVTILSGYLEEADHKRKAYAGGVL